ncbi:hypothetical protein GCM10025771_13570 [Niveibacterium umoris]|uniref:Uncharacterized protein n=1 Tax=Niveibacterium umoris TaxID=1193620 RepID=A0A840BQI3_9RHOO|nr:hypothetical protein [Niveibacterium umoris]MBB4013086.1 hypothetical protein [Niveibacterium umoris]
MPKRLVVAIALLMPSAAYAHETMVLELVGYVLFPSHLLAVVLAPVFAPRERGGRAFLLVLVGYQLTFYLAMFGFEVIRTLLRIPELPFVATFVTAFVLNAVAWVAFFRHWKRSSAIQTEEKIDT